MTLKWQFPLCEQAFVRLGRGLGGCKYKKYRFHNQLPINLCAAPMEQFSFRNIYFYKAIGSDGANERV